MLSANESSQPAVAGNPPVGSRSAHQETRLPSLDGLRAISVLGVLLGHLAGTHGFPRINGYFRLLAPLGVTTFFVISGFLITSLLMHEHDAHGRISLKLFYARRSIRIFPASYAFIAVVTALWLGGLIQLEWRDIVHAVTYTVNFEPGRPWITGHLWSLSVEEQFYLLWPLTFSLMGSRKASWAAFAMLFVGILARIVNRIFLIGTPLHDLEMFPMVADSLATGCLLARFRGTLEQREWYLRLFSPLASLGLLLLIAVIAIYSRYTIVSVFGTTLINLALAVLIHRSVYHAGSPIGRLLNWKPLAFLGVLSYSLYLWQQPFLNHESSSWVSSFPQNLAFAIVAALCSYFLLERPLLSLRHRLRVRSEN